MNTTYVSEPTAKQLGYLESLLDQADRLLSERERITGCEWPEATAEVARMRETDGRTRREVSGMIETAKRNNGLVLAELEGLGWEPNATQRPARETHAFVTEVGMYRVGERIFKVLPARHSDRLYAKELTDFHWEDGRPVANEDAGDNLKFAYAKGAMAIISDEHRMSPEDEREFGKLIGHCIDCGKLLTHPKSIDWGKGPVCSDNYTH